MIHVYISDVVAIRLSAICPELKAGPDRTLVLLRRACLGRERARIELVRNRIVTGKGPPNIPILLLAGVKIGTSGGPFPHFSTSPIPVKADNLAAIEMGVSGK